MRFRPSRRWFQFRLSTWFVLVAILGWAMTCRPYVITHRTSWTVPIRYEVIGPEFKLSRDRTTKLAPSVHSDWQGFKVEYVHADGATAYYSGSRRSMNYQFAWPLLALAAFLAWKVAWAIGPRLVQRRPCGLSSRG